MSILRNGHVAVTNLGVKGHTIPSIQRVHNIDQTSKVMIIAVDYGPHGPKYIPYPTSPPIDILVSTKKV